MKWAVEFRLSANVLFTIGTSEQCKYTIYSVSGGGNLWDSEFERNA